MAMVGTFLLGYEEEIEASCMRSIVEWAITGKANWHASDCRGKDDRPAHLFTWKAIELGASFALEGGADVIIVPYPGSRSLETIAAFVSVPWLLKPTGLDTSTAELEEALGLGATGLFLDHRVFGIAESSYNI